MTFSECNGDIFTANADIICHQVNCRGVMGTGIAKQVKSKNPCMFDYYRKQCLRKGRGLLGSAIIFPQDKGPGYIANLFGQDGYGREKQHTDYDAMENALLEVRNFAQEKNLQTIAVPYKMGCGLAGGNWNIVLDIIQRVFSESDLKITIWKFEI